MKKLSPGEKAWATRRANQQKAAQKRGGGQRRGHRGGKKKHQVPAVGFKRIKKGSRKGEVFPILTPGQKAWQTRRGREKGIEPTKPTQTIYARQWEIPSRTQKGKFYKVSLRTDGVWMCSCPAWIFQGGPIADRSACPHIREAQRIAGVEVKEKKAHSFKDFKQQFNAYPWNMKSLKKLARASLIRLFKDFKLSGRTFEAWAKRLNLQLMEEGRTTKQRLGYSAPEGKKGSKQAREEKRYEKLLDQQAKIRYEYEQGRLSKDGRDVELAKVQRKIDELVGTLSDTYMGPQKLDPATSLIGWRPDERPIRYEEMTPGEKVAFTRRMNQMRVSLNKPIAVGKRGKVYKKLKLMLRDYAKANKMRLSPFITDTVIRRAEYLVRIDEGYTDEAALAVALKEYGHRMVAQKAFLKKK